MESKTCVKFAHIIVFFLLATSFETLLARKESDGPEVIKLLKELKSDFVCKGKLRWPELVGVPSKIAKGIIEKENSFITKVQILLNGSPVTFDFSCIRVRIFENIFGNVVDIPIVG